MNIVREIAEWNDLVDALDQQSSAYIPYSSSHSEHSKPRQSSGFMCSQALGARKRTLSPSLAIGSCSSRISIDRPALGRRMRHLTRYVGRYLGIQPRPITELFTSWS